jgi:hypothetical protein
MPSAPSERFHALHGYVIPTLAKRYLHNADDLVVHLQYGPLFDMRLEISADFVRRPALAGIADRRERRVPICRRDRFAQAHDRA